MPEYRGTELALVRKGIDWGAIWGGVFCFFTIFVIFGVLGLAIFASVQGPGPSSTGAEYGIGAWTVVLTIIAMYVGGWAAGRLAGFSSRQEGMIHGFVVFGLSVVSMLVLVSLGGSALIATATQTATGAAAAGGPAASTPYLVSLMTGLGWGGFVALLLGWLAALAGAASAAPRRIEREVREIRPAA
jgi:hypothetical protein